MATPANSPLPPAPQRLSWPARIIVVLVLSHMIFRSTDVLYPWDDWVSEFKIERMPRPLPTRDDLAKLCEKADGAYAPALEEFRKCFASLPGYWNPVPAGETRELLDADQILWEGLRLNPAVSTVRKEHHLPDGIGLMIMDVDVGSEAEKADLQVGDLIVKIDGAPAESTLERFRTASQAGLKLTLLRDGKENVVDLVFNGPPRISQIQTVLAWIKYSLAWAITRCQWCEAILNIDQEWPMFSPNVGRKKYPARARLIYADGSETTVRQRSDPEDLTAYFRWGPGKYLGYDRGISDDSGNRWYACPGWCNFLSHQYPTNAAGARLKEIKLYQVRYDFPPPEVDARVFLTELMEKTRDHTTVSDKVYTTFYTYDPVTKTGSFLRARQTRYAQ